MLTLPRIAWISALALASAAHAQPSAADPNAGSSKPATRRTPAQTTSASEEARGAMSTSDAYARTGGSLMRASRGVEVPGEPNGSLADPRVASMSFHAGPPPPQRIIRPGE